VKAAPSLVPPGVFGMVRLALIQKVPPLLHQLPPLKMKRHLPLLKMRNPRQLLKRKTLMEANRKVNLEKIKNKKQANKLPQIIKKDPLLRMLKKLKLRSQLKEHQVGPTTTRTQEHLLQNHLPPPIHLSLRPQQSQPPKHNRALQKLPQQSQLPRLSQLPLKLPQQNQLPKHNRALLKLPQQSQLPRLSQLPPNQPLLPVTSLTLLLAMKKQILVLKRPRLQPPPSMRR